jgi:hypothetical protein
MIDEKARVEAKDANMELGRIPILSFTRKTESKRPHICWTLFERWTYSMNSREDYAFIFVDLVKTKNIKLFIAELGREITYNY